MLWQDASESVHEVGIQDDDKPPLLFRDVPWSCVGHVMSRDTSGATDMVWPATASVLEHEPRRMSTLRCGSPKRATTAPRLLLSVRSYAVHPASLASLPHRHVAGKLRGEAKRPSRTPGRGMGAFLARLETKAVRLYDLFV